MSSVPGGLDVLWKEVPEDCKLMFHYNDIPDTALTRGYFNVCELIALKRLLLRRYQNGGIDFEAEHHEMMQLQEQERLDQHNQLYLHGQELQLQQRQNGPQAQEPNSVASNDNGCGSGCAHYPVDPVAGPSSATIHHYNTMSTVITGTAEPVTQAQTQVQQQSRSNTMSTSNNGAVGNGRECGTGPIPPPPPYRSITLVLKLLQIGNYLFRSFSEINPNRCRVLFNTQHILYECHLPVVQPIRESFQPLRKLLTIDIRFDQISMLRFEADRLFIRVEGPPNLTVTYNPVTPEDNVVPNISPEDQFLLDQIEQGHLRLSPCHQLFFLNERLVQNLQSHFREMPQFRHFLTDFGVTQEQQQQHQHYQQPAGP